MIHDSHRASDTASKRSVPIASTFMVDERELRTWFSKENSNFSFSNMNDIVFSAYVSLKNLADEAMLF